jgi:7,8-dihydro-6-hydroxymethylpterin-pyrophosphokinase
MTAVAVFVLAAMVLSVGAHIDDRLAEIRDAIRALAPENDEEVS